MLRSTHDNTDGICPDRGQTVEVRNRTISHTSESSATQPPTIMRFCTFAVDTGLTHSPGLPPELRLMVYKAAFPEMDQPIGDEEPEDFSESKRVYIGTFMKRQAQPDPDLCKYCNFRKRICWNNRLRRAFTGNFARDPTTRTEFLTEYLRQVRFYKDIEEHNDGTKANSYLWRFLSLLDESGLLGQMKHLTIETHWNAMAFVRPHVEKLYWDAPIGHILAVLFRFRVKCELSFIMGPPTYKPILGRMTEIVKVNMSRDKIDKYFTSSCSDPYHDEYFKETNKLFSDDAVLSESIDRFEKITCEECNRMHEYLHDHPVLKYPIDFSE